MIDPFVPRDPNMMNIGREAQNDPHYRYRMPKPLVIYEGRNTGVRTILENASEVAQALEVPPIYISKFFNQEFGAQCKLDKQDRVVVNGKFPAEEILEKLFDFTDKFVLCKQCGLPETEMSVDRQGNIKLICASCSYETKVNPREKLATFIAKHPPPRKKTFKKKQALDKTFDEEDINKKVEKLSVTEETSPVDKLRDYMKKNANASNDAIIKVLKREKANEELGNKEMMCLIFEVFLQTEDIINEIKKKAPIIRRFCKGESCQKVILAYLEELVGVREPSLMKQMPRILEAFYDHDILEEDVILDWSEKKEGKDSKG
jgi:translation initiation factor 5